MQTIRLKRTGREDLVFSGMVLASVDNQDRNESNFSWLKLSLYQTSSEAYILGLTLHRYSPAGVNNLCSAVAFHSIEDIQEFLVQEKCRDISALVHKLVKEAVKTRKVLKCNNLPSILTPFDNQLKEFGGYMTTISR
ncbi:hypothetical protein [Desulfonatronum thioautotrophicum]|uniref:hypothetical protein n=1 Tax=Desulfonatronum thioautotrophicum TaxID=617001 RepID=UPI0006996163|nr:hypothetical protein [Desulfonatronum thioautotrophicum]